MTQRGIAVVGGGAWGTALAVHAARLGHRTRLWVFERDLAEQIRSHGTNSLYLPGVPIPATVRVSSELAECLADSDLVACVVPSSHARTVYREMRASLTRGTPLVVATKGIEEGSLALPLEVVADELGDGFGAAVLSGPSFARELADGKATAVVVAGESERLVAEIQAAFSSGSFRLYANADPVGVQIAGALKNVIAIAAGVADSLALGFNLQAALITRGLAEMARLGEARGAQPQTFSGLAGLGDLVLTCNGQLSRNRQLGQAIGRGERLREILAATRSVAEGVHTTRSARELARRESVEMPIVDEIHGVLFDERDPRAALDRLMGRPLTTEVRRLDGTS